MDGRLQAKLLRALQEREIDRGGRLAAGQGGYPHSRHLQPRPWFRRRAGRIVPRGPALSAERDEPEAAAAARTARRRHRAGRPLHPQNTRPPTACPSGPCRRSRAKRLLSHRWPGNVRELENAMHRAVLLSTGSEIEEFAIRLPDGQPMSAAPDAQTARTASMRPKPPRAASSARPSPAVEQQLIIDNAQPLPRQPHATRPTSSAISIRHAAQQAEGNTPRPAFRVPAPRAPPAPLD